jgi:hypothetical protein
MLRAGKPFTRRLFDSEDRILRTFSISSSLISLFDDFVLMLAIPVF